jgi:hypothetical protein
MMLWKNVGTQPIDTGSGFALPWETFEADLPEARVTFYTQIGALAPAEPAIEAKPHRARFAPEKEAANGD